MKTAKLITAGASTLLLAGCNFGSSIDSLMTPPKLSVEQQQIYTALTDVTGTSISLKYPKSGKYLSAFIIDDIDGDGGNEAVVFYEKNSIALEENTLRINILDSSGGNWRSVFDAPAKGAEIEKVMISQLGSNERINLIIGSSLINRSEKNVSVYTYSEGTIEETFSQSYSFMDVTDLDSDSMNEFLLLEGSSMGSPATANAYRLDEDGVYHRFSCPLNGNFTEFDSISYGTVCDGKTGLYIDAFSGTGLIQTDVVYMDESGLKKVFADSGESLSTVRSAGCSSFDIDNDGTPEIPVQTVAMGYEEIPESEQLKITEWKTIDSNFLLKKKYSSYYSINAGYIFLFPEKWQNRVTVRRDPINDEIVFCEFSNGTFGRELLRIYYAEDEISRDDRISSGYMLLHTKGESSCLAFIPEENSENNDGLSINSGDTAICFRFKE